MLEGLFLPSYEAASPCSPVRGRSVALCTLPTLSWPKFSGSLELRQLQFKVTGLSGPAAVGRSGEEWGALKPPGSSASPLLGSELEAAGLS